MFLSNDSTFIDFKSLIPTLYSSIRTLGKFIVKILPFIGYDKLP